MIWRLDAFKDAKIRCMERTVLQLLDGLSAKDNDVCDCLYQAQWPPSMRRSDPVMKLLASLIKKAAAPLYSSGLLNLPSIFCVGHSLSRSGNLSKSFLTISVTIYPGEMVFTRMPNSPHSEARLRASWSTPALEALYAGQIRPYV